MPMMKQRINEATWIEKEGRWRISIMRDGVRRKFYSATVGKSGKIEAEKKADAWLKESIHDENKKCAELFDMYIEDMRRNDLYTKQYEGYGKRYIKPHIGRKRISDLKEQDLQDILTDGYRHGLYKKTLQNVRACISSFLRFCRAGGFTTLRPEMLRVNKKAPTSQKRTLQPNELRVLFASEETTWHDRIVKDWYIYAYRFAVATGMRPGELCGLRWQDIKNEKTVSLCESFNNDKVMTTGKNDNARRTFMLNDEAHRALNAQKIMLKEERIVSPWVFPRQDTGDISTQQKILRSFHKYCEHNGIKHTTLYELRHTYVSVNKEMPTELLKAQVGHAESMRTFDVYGHELQGEQERAARYSTLAFNSILFSDDSNNYSPTK